MDKNLAGLLGAMGALVVAAPQAATASPADLEAALQASSYADLLKPIPNALALWKSTALVESEPAAEEDRPLVETVQYYDHHHHHHHHYRHRRHWRRWVRPLLPPPYAHHHHHHHHHHAAVVIVPPRAS